MLRQSSRDLGHLLGRGCRRPDIDQAATDLTDSITPEMITKWSASDPRDWANESFAIAESTKTQYCVMHTSACDKPAGDVQINADYLRINEAIVKEHRRKLPWAPPANSE
jgi:hypothetical protein